MKSQLASDSPDTPPPWVFCACCARAFAKEGPDHAPGCAADLFQGTITIEAGSRFARGSVFLVSIAACLEIADGPLCDLCIERLEASRLIFSA